MDTPASTQPSPILNWADYRNVLDPTFLGFLPYESDAVAIRAFQPRVVHGLLQTPEYAQSLSRTTARQPTSPETVTRQLEARTARQDILNRDGVPLHFIFDASVLRRPTEPGHVGERILHDQLRHLLKLRTRPNITIQILPFRCGIQPGINAGGSFTIVELSDPVLWHHLVYLERPGGGSIRRAPEEIATYQEWFAGLAATATTLHDYLALHKDAGEPDLRGASLAAPVPAEQEAQ